jgi:Transposase
MSGATVLAGGKYGTDTAGYGQMLAAARRFADRVWAVEGCNGIGRHLAHRLVHDGEVVFDVPPKLSAQVRVFATGDGRKTDPVDAHSAALVALNAPGLVQVQVEEDLVVMSMLADRRDEPVRARTQIAGRLHRLLLELDRTVDALAAAGQLGIAAAGQTGWPSSPGSLYRRRGADSDVQKDRCRLALRTPIARIAVLVPRQGTAHPTPAR